jgi:hypothetical protein
VAVNASRPIEPLARSSGPAFALLALIVGGGAGFVVAHNAKVGFVVVVAAVLVLAFLQRPANLAIIALLGVFVVQRLGTNSYGPGSAGGISYSDAALTGAALMSLPTLIKAGVLGRLRVPLIGLAVYLACLLPTLIANPSRRADLEFAHRVILVGGALLVGAWIANAGAIRTALRALTGVASVIGLAAIANSARNGLLPGQPFQLNKNFLGALLAAVLVVVIVAPSRLELSRGAKTAAIVFVGGGLFAAQSRGALLGAALALLLAFMFGGRAESRRARAFALLLVGVFGIAVVLSVRAQLNLTKADLQNSSIGVRFNVERETRHIWHTSPIEGVGLKYFNSGQFGYYAQAPNNVIDNELAESGLIGLAGFAALQGGALAAGFRRRRDNSLVLAGFGVVAAELLHGMVDIYWQAGVVSLPFIILGMGLAAAPDAPTTPAPKHRAGPRRVLAPV